MNHRAFTLIELLVVVAIIGILAAVGGVAYNGYSKSAKKAAAHANFKMVIKYMVAENTKCELGNEKLMDGNLTCAGRTIDSLMLAAKNAFSDLKNPIDSNNAAITIGGDYQGGTISGQIGIIRMHKISLKQIRFGVCYKYKCSDPPIDNFLEKYVNFLD